MENAENQPLSVFITGATTGVGRVLTRQLVARGYSVTGLVDSTAAGDLHRMDGGLPVYGDGLRRETIRAFLNMARADVAVHLAPQALNVIPHYLPDWKAHARMVAKSTSAVVEAAGHAGTQRVIYPGFAFLYGDHHGEAVDESAHLDTGIDPVFKPAFEAEAAVLDGGVPGYVLRAGYLYGGHSPFFNTLEQELIDGKGFPEGHGHAAWIHESDLASAILAIVERDAAEDTTGQVYNIVDDEPLSPTGFLNAFADAISVSHPGKPMPFMDYLRPNMAMKALLSASAQVKNDKAKSELGWKPDYPTVHAGLQQAMMVLRAGTNVTAS